MPSEPTGETLPDVASRWDTTAAARCSNPIQGWMDSPLVWETHVLPKLGGGPGRHWLPALVERLGIPATGRWLSLGCGAAGTEIAASGWGLFASMLALDASPGSLEIARQAATKQQVTNIEFGSADLNDLKLPSDAFDAILMNMSLHHVEQLRRSLAQVRRALRPRGFLIVNEYVGPRQFQFTPLQLALVRELLAALPARYRQDSATGREKTEYVPFSLEHWKVADPSEAIRSDRILPELARQFRVLERIDYGGTILHLLLEHIVHNFDAGKEDDVAWMKMLSSVEDTLVRRGVIPSDFTLVTLRKPAGFLSRMRAGVLGR